MYFPEEFSFLWSCCVPVIVAAVLAWRTIWPGHPRSYTSMWDRKRLRIVVWNNSLLVDCRQETGRFWIFWNFFLFVERTNFCFLLTIRKSNRVECNTYVIFYELEDFFNFSQTLSSITDVFRLDFLAVGLVVASNVLRVAVLWKRYSIGHSWL